MTILRIHLSHFLMRLVVAVAPEVYLRAMISTLKTKAKRKRKLERLRALDRERKFAGRDDPTVAHVPT